MDCVTRRGLNRLRRNFFAGWCGGACDAPKKKRRGLDAYRAPALRVDGAWLLGHHLGDLLADLLATNTAGDDRAIGAEEDDLRNAVDAV